VSNGRQRQKGEHAIEHAKAGAQNWNEHERTRQNFARAPGQRRLDFMWNGLPCRRSVPEKQHRDFLECATKIGRSGLL
jgi:hypothetical protein